MPTSSIDIHGEINGQTARLFTLTNAKAIGMQVKISELRSTFVSVAISDEDANHQALTIGHDSFEGWANNSNACFGATVGRFENRIGHGDYFITTNEGLIPTGEIRSVIDTPMDSPMLLIIPIFPPRFSSLAKPTNTTFYGGLGRRDLAFPDPCSLSSIHPS